MKNNNLLANFPDLVRKYWDFDKNIDDPKNINLNSSVKYFWKDETGSFRLSPIELVKKNAGTSFNEQSICFYCRKIFENVFNRYKYKTQEKNIEIDIFIPEINLAIEYDGVFWHKNKIKNDLQKDKILLKENITLLRIRENDLPLINEENTYSITYDLKNDKFDKVINEIFKFIKNYIKNNNIVIDNNKLTHLFNFNLSSDEFENDKIEILNQYRTTYIENNITKTCLIKYWDYEKNKNILPQKISPSDNIKIWFRCEYGFSKQVSVSSIQSSHIIHCVKRSGKICKNCNNFYCPFVNYCIGDINNKNRNFNLSICKKLIKYYFTQILDDSVDINAIKNSYNDACINNEQIIDDCSDNVYEFYKANKKQLLESQVALAKLKYTFYFINLTPKYFNDLNTLDEFLKDTNLYVHKINYIDFDNNEINIKWLIEYLRNEVENNKRYDLLEISIKEQNLISKSFVLTLKTLVKELQKQHKYSIYKELLKQYETLLN